MIFLASPYTNESEKVMARRTEACWRAAAWLMQVRKNAVYPAIGVGHGVNKYIQNGVSHTDWTFINDPMIALSEEFCSTDFPLSSSRGFLLLPQRLIFEYIRLFAFVLYNVFMQKLA